MDKRKIVNTLVVALVLCIPATVVAQSALTKKQAVKAAWHFEKQVVKGTHDHVTSIHCSRLDAQGFDCAAKLKGDPTFEGDPPIWCHQELLVFRAHGLPGIHVRAIHTNCD